MTYQHRISTTTFESNNYNLGHYMRDNSMDLFFQLTYKPIRGLRIDLSYNYAVHGNQYDYRTYDPPDQAPILEDKTWQQAAVGLKAKYEFFNNAYVFAGIILQDVQAFEVDGLMPEDYLEMYTPEMFWGNTTTMNLGFNIGF